MRTQGSHYLFTLSSIKMGNNSQNGPLAPLNYLKEKIRVLLIFIYKLHTKNFKILALTVPDPVLSVTHASQTDCTALHGQTQTNMPPQLLPKLGAIKVCSEMVKNRPKSAKYALIYGSSERCHGNAGRINEVLVLVFNRVDIWLF